MDGTELLIRAASAGVLIGVASYTVGMLHYARRRLPRALVAGLGASTGVVTAGLLFIGTSIWPVVLIVAPVLGVANAAFFVVALRMQDAFRRGLGQEVISPRLLLATNNAGKVAEFRALLEGCGWELVTPKQLGIELDVDEVGQTYAENATLKATAFADASGITSLADDSGLEVDALDGRPGVRSARYAGPGLTDEQRVQALLGELAGVPDERRGARFRAVIAVADPAGRVETVEGKVEGRIAHEPRGENGFGYDPIFLLPDRGLTTAELPSEEKHAVSHRGEAARKARALLEGWARD